MIVVDASLATKWLLDETDSAVAADFLKRHKGLLHAPDILFVEVAGALMRVANAQKTRATDMIRLLAHWTEPGMERAVKAHRTDAPLLAEAATLAIRLGHPLKDCLYLALAQRLDAELATCDARFRDRAVALYPRVKLLADYS